MEKASRSKVAEAHSKYIRTEGFGLIVTGGVGGRRMYAVFIRITGASDIYEWMDWGSYLDTAWRTGGVGVGVHVMGFVHESI